MLKLKVIMTNFNKRVVFLFFNLYKMHSILVENMKKNFENVENENVKNVKIENDNNIIYDDRNPNNENKYQNAIEKKNKKKMDARINKFLSLLTKKELSNEEQKYINKLVRRYNITNVTVEVNRNKEFNSYDYNALSLFDIKFDICYQSQETNNNENRIRYEKFIIQKPNISEEILKNIINNLSNSGIPYLLKKQEPPSDDNNKDNIYAGAILTSALLIMSAYILFSTEDNKVPLKEKEKKEKEKEIIQKEKEIQQEDTNKKKKIKIPFPCYTICYTKDTHLAIEDMKRDISNSCNGIPGKTTFVLTGQPGVGKTELAKQTIDNIIVFEKNGKNRNIIINNLSSAELETQKFIGSSKQAILELYRKIEIACKNGYVVILSIEEGSNMLLKREKNRNFDIEAFLACQDRIKEKYPSQLYIIITCNPKETKKKQNPYDPAVIRRLHLVNIKIEPTLNTGKQIARNTFYIIKESYNYKNKIDPEIKKDIDEYIDKIFSPKCEKEIELIFAKDQKFLDNMKIVPSEYIDGMSAFLLGRITSYVKDKKLLKEILNNNPTIEEIEKIKKILEDFQKIIYNYFNEQNKNIINPETFYAILNHIKNEINTIINNNDKNFLNKFLSIFKRVTLYLDTEDIVGLKEAISDLINVIKNINSNNKNNNLSSFENYMENKNAEGNEEEYEKRIISDITNKCFQLPKPEDLKETQETQKNWEEIYKVLQKHNNNYQEQDNQSEEYNDNDSNEENEPESIVNEEKNVIVPNNNNTEEDNT